MTTTIEVTGSLWVGDADNPMENEPVLEGANVQVVIERTDADEVAVHMTLPGGDNALVSLYLPRVAAVAVSKLIEHEALRDF